MNKIRIPLNNPTLVGNEIKYILDAIKKGDFGEDGEYVKKCERWFEEELKCKKAFLTSSCTTSIEICAQLLGIKEGDEIIMPSYNFVSAATAFASKGAKIIFVDIRPDTMNINENLIEEAITKKTKAILPVHYAGVSCEMEKILKIAKKYDIFVVEDAAHAMLAKYKEKYLGTLGDLGAFFLADIAHPAGLVAVMHTKVGIFMRAISQNLDMARILVAAGVYPSPVPYADFVTFTTHKTLRGPRGAVVLSRTEFSKKIDSAVFPGSQGGPFMHVIAAKAVCFKEAMQPEFKNYAEQVVRNARVLAEEFAKRGYKVITGGTDSHIVLIDVSPKGVSGGDVERELYRAGIVLNKNVIPFDPRPPMNPSGIRIGTPSVTTRGMKEEEMRIIASLIDDVISSRFSEEVVLRVRNSVAELCRKFPFYSDFIQKFVS